jgi:UDP-glucose 4-epimerase
MMNGEIKISSIKGKNILITGGLGFVGSNLAVTCVEHGADVTIYDSLERFAGGNLANIREIRDSVVVIPGDIRDLSSLSRAVVDQDYIFHCAAHTSHPNSIMNPFLDIDINCKGTMTLLESVRRFGSDSKLVHIGTSTQIGQMLQNPIDENHPEFPMDIYSANKGVTEKYIQIYHKTYDIDTTVIRAPNLYGPRACISNPNYGFINYFIGLALAGKSLTIYGTGKQVRNFLYIDDCVRAMIFAVLDPKSIGEIFFVSSYQQYTVADVATEICNIIGGKVMFVEWPKDRLAIEIGDAIISSKKIYEKIGWEAQYSLKQGLEATKRYYSSCLSSYLT